jgi:hypothetical protein
MWPRSQFLSQARPLRGGTAAALSSALGRACGASLVLVWPVYAQDAVCAGTRKCGSQSLTDLPDTACSLLCRWLKPRPSSPHRHLRWRAHPLHPPLLQRRPERAATPPGSTIIRRSASHRRLDACEHAFARYPPFLDVFLAPCLPDKHGTEEAVVGYLVDRLRAAELYVLVLRWLGTTGTLRCDVWVCVGERSARRHCAWVLCHIPRHDSPTGLARSPALLLSSLA